MDGDFGPATKAAAPVFQKSEGLLAAFLKDRERAIKLVNGCSTGLDRFSETYNIGNQLLV
jgi:hypothetical protein